MKAGIILVVSLAVAEPAYAQLGAISKGLKRAQQAQDMVITDKEEVQIGEGVSTQLRQRFGVVQDKAVHRYVSLIGTLVAQNSPRPNLTWTFIVLDTDGVNAFASPGGFIHVTRGALALVQNEAELAGVLGHEIGHVAEKHTIKAIQKSKAVEIGSEEAAGNKPFVDRLAQVAYQSIIENAFDRGDEMDADKIGARAATKAGYAPAGLHAFLTRLGERNKAAKDRNGLFASHPDLKARQEGITKLIEKDKLTADATVEARYKEHITYTPTDVTEVPTVAAGSAGLVGGSSVPKEGEKTVDEKKGDAKKNEEAQTTEAPKKKRGFGLGSLTKPLTGGGEKQSAQVSASAGARGVAPDRDAKGGGNPAVIAVTVTAAELAEFKKGIA
jgi:predicted Zn-dependent protease